MSRRTISRACCAVLLLASVASCGRGRPPDAPRTPVEGRPGVTEAEEGDGKAERRTVYVPAYSHILTSDDARPYNLAVTLSVRNTDPARPIVVGSVRYYDRDGRPVRQYVKRPLRLAPMAAVDFFVAEGDTAGGSSASFLVEWSAEGRVSGPVIEAVMIGTAGTQGISFVSPGRPLPVPDAP